MFAADTNVLARFVLGDDPVQLAAVVARFEKIHAAGETVLVHAVVLAELSWVLKSLHGYSRAEVAGALGGLLDAPLFALPDRPEVAEAIRLYARGPADFADYLILELARAEGARTLLTFDGNLLKNAHCRRP